MRGIWDYWSGIRKWWLPDWPWLLPGPLPTVCASLYNRLSSVKVRRDPCSVSLKAADGLTDQYCLLLSMRKKSINGDVRGFLSNEQAATERGGLVGARSRHQQWAQKEKTKWERELRGQEHLRGWGWQQGRGATPRTRGSGGGVGVWASGSLRFLGKHSCKYIQQYYRNAGMKWRSSHGK